jgi:hypothetical protein
MVSRKGVKSLTQNAPFATTATAKTPTRLCSVMAATSQFIKNVMVSHLSQKASGSAANASSVGLQFL